VQSEELAVAVGLAVLLVVPVDLLVGGAVQEVRQEGVGEGVLQVEDAAGPAAARGVVYGHRPPLQVILKQQKCTSFCHQPEIDVSQMGGGGQTFEPLNHVS